MAESRLDLKMMMDATSVQRTLTSVKAQFKEFATSKFDGLKEMFGVAAAIGGMKVLGDRMVELRRRSEDLGASTDFLQSLEMMSVKFGGTAESANNAMLKLTEVIGQARTEGGAAEEKFKRFGVSLYDVNGQARNTEAVFKEIAEVYKASGDANTKAALALEFFGKTGRDINNILGEGKMGIDAYTESMKKLGLVASVENVNAVADAWTNLKSNVGGGLATVFGFAIRLVNVLARIQMVMMGVGGNIRDIVSQIKDAWSGSQTAPDMGTRAGDEEQRRKANAKAIEDLTKARATSAASQMTDEGKLTQLGKARVDLEAKIAETAEGSVERIKLENELLANGYEARKLQLAIAEKIVEQEKLGQQLSAAENQLAINKATSAELAMKMQISKLEEVNPARVGLEKQLGDLVQKRMKMEQEAQRLELQQMVARQAERENELKGIGHTADEALARENKKKEIANGQLEIAKKKNEIEQAGLKIQTQQAEAQERATKASQSLREAKESRFKFTLGELAAADPRQFRGGIRSDIIGARDVQRLEALAMQANVRNDPKERDRLQELADKRRESLGFLKKEERFPFQDLKLSAKQSADELQELLKSGNAQVQVKQGK